MILGIVLICRNKNDFPARFLLWCFVFWSEESDSPAIGLRL